MNDFGLQLLCILGLLSLSSACYIQNCPRGGKRSFPDQLPRQCMACGPGDRGRCFGPNICCVEEMGCYVGSPESARCAEEDYLPYPCESDGKPCGSENGHCAAPMVCCDSKGCVEDPECQGLSKNRPLTDQSSALMGPSPEEIIYRILYARERSQY